MEIISVKSIVKAPIAKVWDCWTNPIHVKNWNFAVSDWHCPEATNDLMERGEFHYTMASKDNSMSFDFWGTHQKIETEKNIESVLGDGRTMKVTFESVEDGILVTEQFEPESQNPPERQKAGWQMILDNFKNYVEQL